MTNYTADASPSKTARVAGLAFLLVIINTILKWIWFLIKGVNAKQMNKTEKFWDMISNDFDKQAKAERSEQTHIKIVETAKKHLNVSDIVLDYGCATGTKALELAGHVKKIYGIDISSKMIEAAKRKAVERKIENVDFAQTTLFDERFKEESFEVILAFNILHLLEDSRQAVQRITELLKPGGLFISITPCLGEKMAFLTKLQFSLFLLLSKIGLFPSIKRFKFSELEDLIATGNLQIIETERFYGELSGYFIVAKNVPPGFAAWPHPGEPGHREQRRGY